MPTTVKSRFREIASELDGRLDKAVHAAADQVAVGAQSRVNVRTGKLKSKIHVRREGQGEYAVVAGDHEAWYGHFVEFGTSHSAPYPFLIPALEVVRPELEAIARAELKDL